MSTQLESSKYFTPEFMATAEIDKEDLATASDLGISEWTGTMTVACCIMGMMGAAGFVNGVINLIHVVNLPVDLAVAEKMSFMPGSEVDIAFLNARIDNQPFLYLSAVMQILIGLAFGAAVGMMHSQKALANRFADLICIGAIFYNVINGMIGFACIPGEIPGLPAELMTTTYAIAIAFVVGVLVVKVSLYIGLVVFLMNKNNCGMFASKGKAESFT